MNTTHIDQQYILQCSSSLKLFKQQTPSLYNCRCNICGDSTSNEFKARLYFIKRDSNWQVYCHRCGYGSNVYRYIELYFPELLSKYRYDIIQAKSILSPIKEEKKSIVNTVLDSIKNFKKQPKIKSIDYSSLLNFADMNDSHPAKQYVVERKIPFDRVLYSPAFGKFVKRIDNGKYKKYHKYNEPRLIIPFYNENKSFILQARSFDKNAKLRYITLKLDDTVNKLYGLNTIDYDKCIYIVEGPIDSMFLNNSIALAGSSINDMKILENRDVVFVFDNEPRAKSIVQLMRKKIKQGYKVTLWPHYIEQKDINEMILAGYSTEELHQIIDDHTVKGKSGLFELENWKKC